MYKEYFGLNENPFDLTPDSTFLYPSKKHQEALAHLTYGIEARKGFILITGEVGAGKTTLCRALLSRVDRNIEVAFVLNSYLNAFEILQAINEDLGIKTKARSKKELVDELNEFLLEQKQKKRNVVVLIDECQNLPFETLEQLRMLSNLETEKEKLIQIIMVGQPELQDILNTPELRQLNQRITVRYHLYPLDYNEMVDYIYHRLKVAGSDGSVVFTEKALKAIFKYSKGVPRIINVVCDNALLAAYVSESKKITYPLVKKSIEEIKGKKPLKDIESGFLSWSFSMKRVLKGVFIGVLCLMSVVSFLYFNDIKESITTYSDTVVNARKLYQTAVNRLREEKVRIDTIRSVERSRPIRRPVVQRKTNPSVGAVGALLSLWKVDGELIAAINDKYKFEKKLDFQQIALDAGLSSVMTWVDFDTLVKLNLPVLLEVSDKKCIRKYLLLKSVGKSKAVIVDGDKERLLPVGYIRKKFIGNAIIFVRGVVNSDEIFYLSSTGKNMKEIQTMLKKLGYYKGSVDGVYDEKLVGVVKRFQRDKGLNPDGIIDINTRLALYGGIKNNKVPRLK